MTVLARWHVLATAAAALPPWLIVSCHLTDSLDGMASGTQSPASDASVDEADAADAQWDGTDSLLPDATSDAENGADADVAIADATLDDAESGSDSASGPCGSGACVGSCRNCDGVPLNGCETDVSIDPQHCGACGHGCDGFACKAGVCEVLDVATGLHLPWGLAVDDTTVFWVEEGAGPGEGRVASVSQQGGPAKTLADGQSSPIAIAVDTAWVFWVNFASGGSVSRVAKSGTAYTQLAVTNAPRALAVDSESVFWSTVEGDIARVPKAGGSPAILTDAGAGVIAIVLHEVHLYWANRLTGTVSRIEKQDTTGTTLTTVANSQASPTALHVDDAFVYWTEAGSTFDGADCYAADGRVLRTPRLQPGIVEELASGQACPVRLTGDATHVYWANHGTVDETELTYRFDGAIARVAIAAPQTPEVLATAQLRPSGIALSATSLFWANRGLSLGQGTIARVAK